MVNLIIRMNGFPFLLQATPCEFNSFKIKSMSNIFKTGSPVPNGCQILLKLNDFQSEFIGYNQATCNFILKSEPESINIFKYQSFSILKRGKIFNGDVVHFLSIENESFLEANISEDEWKETAQKIKNSSYSQVNK